MLAVAPPVDSSSLPIKGEAREKIMRAVVEETMQSVDDCSDRNDKFAQWDYQLRGDPSWAGLKRRWKGGSEYEDPITREHHMDTQSRLLQVLRSDQWWTFNATKEEDADDASTVEAWMNDKLFEFDLNERHAYDLTYNAGRYSYAIMWCGWSQEYKTCPLVQYEDLDTGDLVDEEGIDPEREYQKVETTYPEATHDGLDIRVCNTPDVYFWPPNAPSIEACTRISERIWMSDHQLLDGIEDYGYDEKAVYEILKAGSAGSTGERREADERDGVTPDTSNTGDYECFMVIGRAPVCIEPDGKPLLKSEERRRDYLWLFEASTRKCFRFDPSPLKTRGYVKFAFLSEPGRMVGDGVCSLLAANQLEGSIAGRFRLDVRDLVMSPTWAVPMEMYEDFKRFGRYPGAIYPVPQGVSPAQIVPIMGDPKGYEAAMQDSLFFEQRSAQMFSSQARGAVTNKERTAEEVGNAAAGADAKTDLLLVGMHAGQKDLARVIMSHYRQFMPKDGETAYVQNKVLKISPDLLEKKFRIAAAGSSESTNPEMQRRKAEALLALVMQSPITQQQIAQGDMTGIYAATMSVARALQVRDPQTIFGPEPSKPPSAEMILQALVAAIQQYAAAGDPNMAMLLEQLQQMMASQIPPQGDEMAEEEAMGLPSGGMEMMGAAGPMSYDLPMMPTEAPMMNGVGAMM